MSTPVNPTIEEQISPDGMPLAQPAKIVVPSVTPPAEPTQPVANQPEPKQAANPNQEIQAELNKPIADDDTIDIGDFAAVSKRVSPTKPEKPAEPAKQVAVEPAKPVEPAKSATQQPAARDFTGIPDDIKPLFERMSNEAFAKMKEVYSENERNKADKAKLDADLKKAKEGGMPDSYYEHEDAYMLTPEFAQTSMLISQSQAVLQHWREQARLVAGGAETYQKLMRDAQGNFVLSEPIKADRTTATQLEQIVDGSQKQLIKFQAQLENMGVAHKNKSSEARNWLGDWEKRAFPLFEDASKPQLKAMVDDSMSKMLHPAYQTNPLAKSLVKAIIVIQTLAQQLNKGNGAPVTPQAAATPVKQPSAAEIAGGGAAPTAKKVAEEDVTTDDFAAVKLRAY